MAFFTRRRGRTASADPGSADVGARLVYTAEMIVRRAWLRDLQELRRLTEVQLQTAVADGVEAYENLRRAQLRGDIEDVVEAQVVFDAATRLALVKCHTSERVNALAEAEFGLRPSWPDQVGEPADAVRRTKRVIVANLRGLVSRTKRRMI